MRLAIVLCLVVLIGSISYSAGGTIPECRSSDDCPPDMPYCVIVSIPPGFCIPLPRQAASETSGSEYRGGYR